MGSGQSFPKDKHVVVVGAGYGGIQVANELLAIDANFTIISGRDCFHHNVGSLRACVKSGFVNRCLIPLKESFGEHLKIGIVVNINKDEKHVVLESGETVPYDIVIIATGTTGPFPVKFDDAKNMKEVVPQYDDIFENIKSCQRIVVVGGGATGVELAVEIAVEYPTKDVTLVHNSEVLINDQVTEKFQSKLKNILKRYHVNTILGERVENLENIPNGQPGTIHTDKGKAIECDLMFKTIGLVVNTKAYKSTFENAMESNGQLKVNGYLEVEGHSDVYALGDCCNTNDIKTGYCAAEQAKFLVKNLSNKFAGKVQTTWKEGSLPFLLMLALGPNSGLGQTTGGWIVGEYISTYFKSKDVLTARFWKEMKQPMPSI